LVVASASPRGVLAKSSIAMTGVIHAAD
jgi:hypothetical protein